MCVYSDRLEQLQGVAPETMYVVTGDGVRTSAIGSPTTPPTTASVKARFEARVFGGSRRARRPTRSRSTTAASAAGTASAPTGAAPTTTSRSSPASPAPSAAQLVDGERADPTSRSARARPGTAGRQDRPPAPSSGSATRPPPGRGRGRRRPVLHELIAPGATDPEASGPLRRGLAAAAGAVAGRPLLRHRGRPVGDRGRARVPVRRRSREVDGDPVLHAALGPRPGRRRRRCSRRSSTA